MKIVFNGTIETKKGGGCSSCGRRTTGGSRFVTNKSYWLPSGTKKAFTMGEVVDVSDTDGQFLLSYVDVTKDGERRVFNEA